MKKLSLLILVAFAATSVAMAQITVPTPSWGGDVLGAHNCYGRGCAACHAPHGGSLGNGAGVATGSGSDPQNGGMAQWGQNLEPYYGKTISFSGNGNTSAYPVTLPASETAITSFSEGSAVILFCVSCHDGSLARVPMMQNQTVEALPVVGGHAPTLFGLTAGNTSTYYANEHPVGPNANVGCGGGHNWDCTGGGATTQPIEMTGTASAQFLVDNPSSFWNSETITACGGASQPACGTGVTWGYNTKGNPLATFSSTGTVNNVTCTTCHNQHSMTVWSVGGKSYSTMFFLKGYYNPTSGGNSVAQFCRNCHGGESNEMNGITTVVTQ